LADKLRTMVGPNIARGPAPLHRNPEQLGLGEPPFTPQKKKGTGATPPGQEANFQKMGEIQGADGSVGARKSRRSQRNQKFYPICGQKN